MPSAIVLIANGTEEIEFVTVYDVLVRAGFNVSSYGVNLGSENYVTCTRRVKIIPDHNLATDPVPKLDHTDGDSILILPGGAPGAKAFCESAQVQELIRTWRSKGGWIGCICAGTTALAASVAGADSSEAAASTKAKVTSHPSVKDEVMEKGWDYSEDRVVVDGGVITSRGPGTAILFALTIVEQLAGVGKREEVAGPMICAETL